MTSSTSVYEQVKQRVKMRLAELLERDARQGERATLDRDTIALHLRGVLNGAPAESKSGVALSLSSPEQERLIAELADEVLGAGPLEPLLADPTVTEIMVNGPSEVFVERQGRLERSDVSFRDERHVLLIIERLLDAAGVSVTESQPCADASLPNGARMNVVIPPIVVGGPTMTIRKKLRNWEMGDYLTLGSLSQQVAEFLQACVKAKVNLVISGGTSTGKTSLVAILSAFIPQEERVITIENAAELELPNCRHWVRLIARAPNMEGRGDISLRTLVRNALRMRPDRIILGEARAGEALDVVQAMHTGHEGVITVLHANSPTAALQRLETLMLMSGLDIGPEICRAQIATAVDVVVHLGRFADGSRRIASIAQVLGLSGGQITLEPLFVFEVTGFAADGRLQGSYRYTGARPKCLEKFHDNNVEVPGWLTK